MIHLLLKADSIKRKGAWVQRDCYFSLLISDPVKGVSRSNYHWSIWIAFLWKKVY